MGYPKYIVGLYARGEITRDEFLRRFSTWQKMNGITPKGGARCTPCGDM